MRGTLKNAFIDDRTPYEDDFKARVFVSMYPNGATLEVVAAMFDVTRERVRQIEASALTRLEAACDRLGVSLETALGLELQSDAYNDPRSVAES